VNIFLEVYKMSDNQNNQAVLEQDVNELIKIRREKLANLRNDNKDPYVITKYDVTANSDFIKNSDFSEVEGKEVSIAGRIISRRIMGKASFTHIQDGAGRVQCYIRRDDVGEEVYADFKKWDIGDIIGVVGVIFKTQTGETSVHATSIKLLSKSLLPLP
jgi:lysyl-tRNA synthetase class 2